MKSVLILSFCFVCVCVCVCVLKMIHKEEKKCKNST